MNRSPMDTFPTRERGMYGQDAQQQQQQQQQHRAPPPLHPLAQSRSRPLPSVANPGPEGARQRRAPPPVPLPLLSTQPVQSQWTEHHESRDNIRLPQSAPAADASFEAHTSGPNHASLDQEYATLSRRPHPLPPLPQRPHVQRDYYESSNQQAGPSSPSSPLQHQGWTSYHSDQAYAQDAYQTWTTPPQANSEFDSRNTISPVRPRELSTSSMSMSNGYTLNASRPVSSTASNIISLYASTDSDALSSLAASNRSRSGTGAQSINGILAMHPSGSAQVSGDVASRGSGGVEQTSSASTIRAAVPQHARALPDTPRASQFPHNDGEDVSSAPPRPPKGKPLLPTLPLRDMSGQITDAPSSSATVMPSSPQPAVPPPSSLHSASSSLGARMDAAHFYQPYAHEPTLPQSYHSDLHGSLSSGLSLSSPEQDTQPSSLRTFTPSKGSQSSSRRDLSGSEQRRRNDLDDRIGSSSGHGRNLSTSSSQMYNGSLIGEDPTTDGMASAMVRRRERGSPTSARYPSSLNRSRSIVGDTIVSSAGAEHTRALAEMPSPIDGARLRALAEEASRREWGKQSNLSSCRSDDSIDMGSSRMLSPMPTAKPAMRESIQSSQMPFGPDEENAYCMLSFIAQLLREAVPVGTHIKGSITFERSFTGKDVVSTLQALIPRETLAWAAGQTEEAASSSLERDICLQLAGSLYRQLFFSEVDHELRPPEDSVDDVYMFLQESSKDDATDLNDFDRELYKANRVPSPMLEADLRPSGIFTAMTPCYSPLCGRPGSPPGASCYSSSCPRSQGSRPTPRLSTILATAATAPVPGASHDAVAWADTVPKALLDSLPKSEVKRQNAIHELVQKEEEFLRDLELLDTLFLSTLQKPASDGYPVLEPSDFYDFVSEVFSNHTELIGHIRALVERLHVRQREEGPVIGSIGDIYLAAALEWSGAFETNMVSLPMARHRLTQEAAFNPRVQDFLERCRQDPRSHRLPMDHFLQRGTTRLPRYNLHFRAILHDTRAESQDKTSLEHAIELVDEQCKSIQIGVAAAETKVKIREYALNLRTKRNRPNLHMDLLSPERQLIHQGRVYRKPDFTEFEWQDLLCMLFDNFLVITKTKKREDGDQSRTYFFIERRPIAVEMIQILSARDPPVTRAMGLSNFHLRSEARDLYPLVIGHLGGKIEPVAIYVPSKEARDEWVDKINEAIGLRNAMQEANKVFEYVPVVSDRFALPASGGAEREKVSAGPDKHGFHGLVTSVVPFRKGNVNLMAIGCADGVWIGLQNDPSTLAQVLYLGPITQIAVLEKFGILVVLADRTLYAYSLDRLVPDVGEQTTSNDGRGQKIAERRDIAFFSVGEINGRTLLIYMKRKSNESVFSALEPIARKYASPSDRNTGGGGGILSRFKPDNKTSDWFRMYKTFFIPSEAHSLQFLRRKLCIICAKGFEIIDPDTLLPGTIPDMSDRNDPRIQIMQNRIMTARAIAIFKARENGFLLCYDSVAFFVDRHGVPIQLDRLIEWEGTPHSVAFREPFLLAFDSRFVEIRHCYTGQLVQIIRTNDLRNLAVCSSTTNESNEPILLTQRISSNAASMSMRRTHDYQEIFELVGTATYNDLMAPSQAVGMSSPGDTTPTTPYGATSPALSVHLPPPTFNGAPSNRVFGRAGYI